MSVAIAPARQALANGAVVLVKETNVTPAVTIHASLLAGTGYDPPGREGTAYFASRTMDRGTLTRSGDQIAEALDNRGVSLAISVNRHTLSVVCTCLVEDFQPILQLVIDLLRAPTFPDAEVAIRRGEILTQIQQDADNPGVVASEELSRLLYGEAHPYGRRQRGRLDTIDAIDRDSLLAFRDARFRPSGVTLAIVGDIDAGRATAVAAAALEPWTAPALEPLASAPAPTQSVRRVSVVPMMDKAQADIAYGFVGIDRADPMHDAAWVMNNILGQYALGGRLGDSIRERQGMAYYVYSALEANRLAGPLFVRAGVNASNVARAVASIDEELTRFLSDGPLDSELSESKRYLIGSMPLHLETNPAIAGFLQMVEFFGLGLDYDEQVPRLIERVTRDQVVDAARRLLDPARATIAVAGPFDGPLS